MTKNQPTKIPFLKILNFILHKNQSDNNYFNNIIIRLIYLRNII